MDRSKPGFGGRDWSSPRGQIGIPAKREVDNFHINRWNLRRSLPLLLACAVYALFGSVVWSAYQGTERRAPLKEDRVVERSAGATRPGELGAGKVAPAGQGVFPIDEVLLRAIRPFGDAPQMAVEPVPASPGQASEPLVDVVEAPPERRMLEASDARPTPATDPGTAGGPPATPSSGSDQAPEPEPAVRLPPKPTFKPLDAITAVASAEATVSAVPDERGARGAPSPAVRVPPKPAFKPFFGPTELVEREADDPPVDSSGRRESPTLLGSLWSGLKALLASASPSARLASGDGGGSLQAARSDARAGDRGSPSGDGDTGDRGSDRDDSGRGGDRDNDRDDGGRGGDRGSDRGSDSDNGGRGGGRDGGGRDGDRGDGGRGGDRGNDRGSDRGDGDRGDGGRGGDRGRD